MFTGIVAQTGQVVSIRPTESGARLILDVGELAKEISHGGSVAVNGACLTAVTIYGQTVEFDSVFETMARTNLGRLKSGDRVNLELSLRPSDRLEGHFVQGHIDTTVRIVEWQDQGQGRLLTVQLQDSEYVKYVVPKGSVALDGISLTVAGIKNDQFTTAIIPTTLQRTTLVQKPVGAVLNFEADILAKTVVQWLERTAEPGRDQALMDVLKRSGFTE